MKSEHASTCREADQKLPPNHMGMRHTTCSRVPNSVERARVVLPSELVELVEEAIVHRSFGEIERLSNSTCYEPIEFLPEHLEGRPSESLYQRSPMRGRDEGAIRRHGEYGLRLRDV